jgi:hypothetical protein
VAGEVGHCRVAEENFGSREGKRQARHGEPVLGQRKASENPKRLRLGCTKVNDLLSRGFGAYSSPQVCPSSGRALGSDAMRMTQRGQVLGAQL